MPRISRRFPALPSLALGCAVKPRWLGLCPPIGAGSTWREGATGISWPAIQTLFSPPTARDYFEIAHGTFLWRRLPPSVKQATKRLVKHSKGHLRDSGLLHRLLHLANLDALLGHPQAGRSWEAMVSEEILRQLEWRGLDCGAFFYRTSAGTEIDLVLEGDVGLVPIEIKSTNTIDRRRLAALREFVADRRCRYGLVITNDSEPRLLDEAIVAIPFSHL